MKKIFFLLLFAGLYMAACDGDGNSPTDGPGYEEGESFTLAFEGMANCTCDAPDLTFTQVVSDSRCPVVVECVWEGEVTVELEVGESTIQLSLHPHDAGLSADTIGQWGIQLLEVNPYPNGTEAIPSEDYELVLMVSAI